MTSGGNGDIRKLWLAYAKTKSDKLRNQLMEHYLHLVKQIAQRIHVKLPREVELDDLISAGTFGLMFAVAGFDPKRKVKFETYCATRIRGAILDELRSWDWVPRLARVRSNKLAAVKRELEVELGREASHEEVAQRVGGASLEQQRTARDGALVRVMSLSRAPDNNDAEHDQECYALEDKREANSARMVDREDVKRMVREDLTRAEQLIVTLYYFEQMTMKEIGLTLDLSESRVSQMHGMILTRLHNRLGKMKEFAVAA